MQREVHSDLERRWVGGERARLGGGEVQRLANGLAECGSVERVNEGVNAIELPGFALAAGADAGEFPREIFPDFMIAIALGTGDAFRAVGGGP
jgi:hypothetical protein